MCIANINKHYCRYSTGISCSTDRQSEMVAIKSSCLNCIIIAALNRQLPFFLFSLYLRPQFKHLSKGRPTQKVGPLDTNHNMNV